MIYFISDLHFFHENIIGFSNRPYTNVEEMNEKMIHNWNSIVDSDDEVFILGDFVVQGNGKHANQILKQLNGKKFLIKGNHDHFINDPDFEISHFEWIKDYYSFRYAGIKFILFHYPILEWDNFFENSLHLYGHVHEKEKEYFENTLNSRAINVGVDVNNYCPISIEKIIDKVSYRK